jgi:hypothetical protein
MLGCTQKNENYYDRSMEALLDGSGSKWTDVIGSGERGFTMVSQRVLEIWEAEGIGTFPVFPVTILPPYPKKLSDPPMYYRLDHKNIEGAEMDYESSGFVDIKHCPECGFSYDWNKTDKLSRFQITPYKLHENTWNGKEIFSIIRSSRICCTEKIVDIAAKYKMTNFEFTPLEIAGSATSFRGVDYLAKDWRKKMVKQLEDFRKNFRPRDPETGEYIQ